MGDIPALKSSGDRPPLPKAFADSKRFPRRKRFACRDGLAAGTVREIPGRSAMLRDGYRRLPALSFGKKDGVQGLAEDCFSNSSYSFPVLPYRHRRTDVTAPLQPLNAEGYSLLVGTPPRVYSRKNIKISGPFPRIQSGGAAEVFSVTTGRKGRKRAE